MIATMPNTPYVAGPREKIAIARTARRPGWSQSALAKELAERGALSRSENQWDARIKNIETDRGKEPSYPELIEIGAVLAVDPVWLSKDDDTPVSWTDTLQSNAALVRFPSGQPVVQIPYWGEVPCGNWEMPEPGDDDLIEVSPRVNTKGTVAVRVRGNSMFPRFSHGQVVVIKLDPEPLDGVVTLVKNGNSELALKLLKRVNGSWELQSINPEYPSCTAESITILGHAIHVEETDPAGLRA